MRTIVRTMSETVKERLKEFAAIVAPTIVKFEESIGKKNSYVNSIRKSISPEVLDKIMEVYPMLNRDWLLFGEGEMLIKDLPKKAEGKQLPFDDFMEVPYLPAYAQAGYLKGYADIDGQLDDTLDTMLVPKEFEKGNYLVIEVTGDSMDNGTNKAVCDGDKILVKEIEHDMWHGRRLNYRDSLFVLMTRDGVVFKQIIDHDLKHNTMTCHGWNPLVHDFKIHVSDIMRIFYVKKIVERRIKF